MHMDNSLCHNVSKVTSKIKKKHISRMPYPPYSSDVSPCNFWLFGMLKQILRDGKFSSSDEIETQLHKHGMTSLLVTFRACSGTGSGVLPGSLRMMEIILANKTRFASLCRLHVEIGMEAAEFLDTLY
jgi:hypothetical protein